MSDLSTAEQETKRLSAALEEAKGKLKGGLARALHGRRCRA